VLCVACSEPQCKTSHEDLPSKQTLQLYLPTNEHMWPLSFKKGTVKHQKYPRIPNILTERLFGEGQINLGYIPLGWSGSGSVVQDHSEYGTSKELMNPLMVTDSSVPLMHHDPSNLGSLILIQITPKERVVFSKCEMTLLKETTFNIQWLNCNWKLQHTQFRMKTNINRFHDSFGLCNSCEV